MLTHHQMLKIRTNLFEKYDVFWPVPVLEKIGGLIRASCVTERNCYPVLTKKTVYAFA